MAEIQIGSLLDSPFDFELPDGRHDSPYRSIILPTPEPLGSVVDAAIGLGYILAKIHGDQLVIPEYMKDNIGEVAQLLARRFDPLYNLVKIHLHKIQRGDDKWKLVLDTALASGVGFFGIVGDLVNSPLFWLGEGVLTGRVTTDGVAISIESDRIHDENDRIGEKWEQHLREQVIQAAKQIGLADKPEGIQELQRQVEELVRKRREAFDKFVEEPHGRARLKRALRIAEEFQQVGKRFEKKGDGLLGHRRAAYISLRNKVYSYMPELDMYTSREDLQKAQLRRRRG